MREKIMFRPMLRPPVALAFSDADRAKYASGDLNMSLRKFTKIVQRLRSLNTESFNPRPLDYTTLRVARKEKCPSCGRSLVNENTKRLRPVCSDCGLKFIRSKHLVHASGRDTSRGAAGCDLAKFFGRYIRVYETRKAEKGLLIPPINYYPGDLARRVLRAVRDALHARNNNLPVLFDRERQKLVFTPSPSTSEECRRGTRGKMKKLARVSPQKAMCYLPTLCCRVVDRIKHGKENQFRGTCIGRVIAGCARLTVGTNGKVAAGNARLPDNVIKTLGNNVRKFPFSSKADIGGEYLSIRYPVIAPGNIAYARVLPGGIRSTADVPSSQYKYNGGDNDGDAFNFVRLQNGLVSNSAIGTRLLMAPWYNMANGGDIKAELDSDAKLGLGNVWRSLTDDIRTLFFATGSSAEAFEAFRVLEEAGRSRSFRAATFSINEYLLSTAETRQRQLQRGAEAKRYHKEPEAKKLPSWNERVGSIRRIIESDAIPRFSHSHFYQSVVALGPLRFPFNDSPTRNSISSSFASGLRPNEFISSCQATFDALAEQMSSQMSLQGNLQYQCQFVTRPMILSADRQRVYNPITRRCISPKVSSLYALNKAKANEETLCAAALNFARMAVGFKPTKRFVNLERTIRLRVREEAQQMRSFLASRS